MLALAAFAANAATSLNGLVSSGFNLYSAQLSINGSVVYEMLYFNPDQPYHTLFRTFTSPIVSPGYSNNNSVSITSVGCSAGTPYYRTQSGSCYTFQSTGTNNACMPNTENNEYGCTFGDVLGFNQGTTYTVTATYIINSTNLFLINGKYYTKFVPYSAGNHYNLETGSNFLINGTVVAGSDYLPNQDVILYIPYEGSTQGFNIIQQNGFGFSNGQSSMSMYLENLLLFMIPVILFVAVWFAFAKKKKEPPAPSQLSDLPNERKPWQVSVYFNPPLLRMAKDFYATLMLDFYRRKIIDINYVDKGAFNKRTWVKINKDAEELDDVEKGYLEVLENIRDGASDKNRDGEYFDVNGAAAQFTMRYKIRSKMIGLSKLVKDDSKQFVKMTGTYLYHTAAIILIFGSIYLHEIILAISSIIMLAVSTVLQLKTPILINYNQDFYEEYEQWMAFKNGLSHLYTIKNSKADAIVMFDKYLVYATALGVADKVLKQFKALNLIDETKFRNYSGVYIASASFSRSFAASTGSGGGGGGGGVGGGGGGGR